MAKKSQGESRSTQHELICLDLSFEGFKKQLEELEDDHFSEVIEALERFEAKVKQVTWQQLYQQSSKNPTRRTGFNYEPINQKTRSGKQIASIRLSRKIRARVCRNGRYMCIISLHPDHDSAYEMSGGEDL